MAYYISRVIDEPFPAAVARVTAGLKHEDFGILSDIDVRATMKAKLGLDMPAYRILGACNPAYAHQALQIENKLGVLLPCNVIMREAEAGRVEVAAVDPEASLGSVGSAELASVAAEIRARLQRTIDSL